MAVQFTKYLAATALSVAASVPRADAQTPRLHPDMRPVIAGDVGALFGSDAYPPEAARAGRQGRVVAVLAVSETGAVTSCLLEVSSGTTSLDEATCRIATTRMRFDPATDHDGHPFASTYRLPVVWKLPETPAPPPVDVSAGPPKEAVSILELAFDSNGVLLSCSSSVDNPNQVVDPCSGARPGTPTPRRFVRDGKPVGAKVIQRFSERVVPDP